MSYATRSLGIFRLFVCTNPLLQDKGLYFNMLFSAWEQSHTHLLIISNRNLPAYGPSLVVWRWYSQRLMHAGMHT